MRPLLYWAPPGLTVCSWLWERLSDWRERSGTSTTACTTSTEYSAVHFPASQHHLDLVAAEVEADQADLPARPPHQALHLVAPRRQLGERGGGGEAECGQAGAGGQGEARPRPAGQVRQRGQAGAIQIGLQPDIQ